MKKFKKLKVSSEEGCKKKFLLKKAVKKVKVSSEEGCKRPKRSKKECF